MWTGTNPACRRRFCHRVRPNKNKKDSGLVPLAILISSAVLMSAIRVELKWTVLSSATGRSIRSSLCGEPVSRQSVRKQTHASLPRRTAAAPELPRRLGGGEGPEWGFGGWESSIERGQWDCRIATALLIWGLICFGAIGECAGNCDGI